MFLFCVNPRPDTREEVDFPTHNSESNLQATLRLIPRKNDQTRFRRGISGIIESSEDHTANSLRLQSGAYHLQYTCHNLDSTLIY
jgi:hypothetical protein